MAYTKYSLTPADNNAAPPNGAPEGMLPSGVNDTMRDMMAQIRDVGDGIRGGTYTMTAPVITGGSVTGVTFSSSSATITGGSVSGITDLAVADGGTGASTVAAAQTNLQIFNFKNRIINGDMRIDQRNAGASITPTAGTVYTLDRWLLVSTVASKFTIQKNAGSVTPPTGFTNYLGATSTSAYTLTSNDFFDIQQIIEGYNVADLGWGTASAKETTLSFWVRSSLTGTFGGSIATTKSAIWVLPFTYTISSANTWTYITVSIPAPTSTGGTNNDNSAGIFIRFGLGSTGTAAGGTAGTWTNAGNYVQPSGTVSVVGTSGATFYITGVQLEVGSSASSFEVRDYGSELVRCQRYYEKSYNTDVVPGTNTNAGWFMFAPYSPSNDVSVYPCIFQVMKRTAPSVSLYTASGTIDRVDIVDTGATTSVTTTANTIGMRSFRGWSASGTTGTPSTYRTGFHFAASAEL